MTIETPSPIRQALVLVGGRGTRMWPLTASTPKSLLPLAGRPFLEHQVSQLGDAGVDEVVLAVGVDQVAAWEAYLASAPSGPRLSLAVEDRPLDTAGAVMAVLDRMDDRFLVLNGDVIFTTAIARFVAAAPSAGAVLALAQVPDPSAYGVVVLDDDGRVERFVEKPAPGTAPADTVNAGLYIVERRALEDFEPGPLSFERRVFPELAARKDLAGVVVDGGWLDIGTPHLYLDTHERVQADTPHLAADDAHVVGRRSGSWSYVGAGASIEAEAEVRESVVLAGATIAQGAVVRRSIVGRNAVIGAGARVIDHVIVGEDAVVGAGCELHAGIRVAPGIELGERSITVRPPR
ncbi:MAG: NDP-sugar synthase [Acidimicrobiia bacterium]|nr:NDP-sugar synthase [Acidimicrobiia bacterium]NNF70356.1 NDP-sugar synthase [Acidimicrobiia bacterium]NNK92540.1 NDP-sugar synthase [Acidimicrobiia bacterium]